MKDGKAIQICASSFIPHLASDILKNECLLSSPPEETILSLKASSSGWVYILWAIAVASLLPPSTEAKKPFVSTLRRINREEERQLQQRERYPSQEGDKRGNLHAREHFRPSVRPSEFLGLDWQPAAVEHSPSPPPPPPPPLLFLLFPSRIRDGRITRPARRGGCTRQMQRNAWYLGR